MCFGHVVSTVCVCHAFPSVQSLPDACLDDLNVSSHSPPIIEQVYFTGDEQRAARLTPLVQECFGPEFTVQYSGLEADSSHLTPF